GGQYVAAEPQEAVGHAPVQAPPHHPDQIVLGAGEDHGLDRPADLQRDVVPQRLVDLNAADHHATQLLRPACGLHHRSRLPAASSSSAANRRPASGRPRERAAAAIASSRWPSPKSSATRRPIRVADSSASGSKTAAPARWRTSALRRWWSWVT